MRQRRERGPLRSPLSLSDLAAHRVGELDAPQVERLEEHFFACASCARRLDVAEGVQAGIASAVREGGVSSSVTGEIVEHLAALGVRLRTYRVARREGHMIPAASRGR